jgi:hypothetical protein
MNAKTNGANRPGAGRAMPRREDIPGLAAALPDFSNWREAMRALRVEPFYDGPDAVPFSRVRATQLLDAARGSKSFNDFYLEH